MKRSMIYMMVIPGGVLALAGAAFLYVTKTESGYRIYLDRLYRREFSDVVVVEPGELARELEGPAPPIVIDTRSPDEYAVSHLPGAILVDPARFSDQDAMKLDRNRPIVAYCSVGYRSGRIVQRLTSLGFTDVRNLYGGIFLWYNQGRPVYAREERVEKIHTYNTLWGMFVTRGGKTVTAIP